MKNLNLFHTDLFRYWSSFSFSDNLSSSVGELLLFKKKEMFLKKPQAGRRRKPSEQPPHIILVLADDLGWNHVSWHNQAGLPPF
jgi:hypothetical protein